jgi:uncharacterized oxidoreductase
MNLSNNTILITGGASGIGLALAEKFQALGNTVIVAGRSKEKLLSAEKKSLKTIAVDLTSRESIESLAAQVLKDYPTLNGVIHCAGIMKNENLLKGGNRSIMEETIMTNVLGTLLLTDLLVPHFLKQEMASIVTVTSGLAFAPLTMTPSYSASKAAIHSYTQSLRYQLRHSKVQVLELVPPYVQTELMGERQARDPMAMPLEDFVNEVFEILKTKPDLKEILVGRVLPQRTSSYQGEEKYQEFFEGMNERLWAARKSEFPS